MSFPTTILILLASGIGLYICFLGYVLTRLWYYNGELGPQPTKYVILPTYIKDKLLHEQEDQAKFQRIDTKTIHGDAEGGATAVRRKPKGLKLAPSRFTGEVGLDLNVNEDEVNDEELKKRIKEEKRISKLPTFVQDDCGDGSQFPDIPAIDPKHYAAAPLSAPPLSQFRSNPGSYMTMGLRKLDLSKWLTVDNTYVEFHAAREHLLEKRHEEVIQVLPEAEAACEELMSEVVEFLTSTYPTHFQIVERVPGYKVIRNRRTKEEFSLRKPWDVHPLEMCARLAMEDFNILQQSQFSGQHYLVASATLFPAGWSLPSRIGHSITDLHGPVPLWKDLPDILGLSYFTRLSTSSFMERSFFFIQVNPDNRPLAKLLFIQRGADFFPGSMSKLRAENIVVRRERQTFRRLPRSGCIVFTVKTSIERLTEIPVDERKNLAKEIQSWPAEIATYKGRDLWGRRLMAFCEGSGSGDVPDVSVVGSD